jgi:hypothetical protein
MSKTMMTQTDFIDLISAYGAKPQNWPQDRRAAMQAFCRDNPQAEALLGREKMLDGWLDSRLEPVPEALLNRFDADMKANLTATQSAAITPLPRADLKRRFIASGIGALAACFIGGFIAVPIAIDMLTGGADLMASLDIISDIFLPTEPL